MFCADGLSHSLMDYPTACCTKQVLSTEGNSHFIYCVISPQENNSVPKECSHGSFSLPFQIKARPCRWCNCWCQVGAARRLCCSQQAGWGYPAAQGFVLHSTSPKATLGEWRSTGSSPPGLLHGSPAPEQCLGQDQCTLCHLNESADGETRSLV